MITTRLEARSLHLHIDDGKLNVLTFELVDQLLGELTSAEENEDIGTVIIRGSRRALSVGLHTDTVVAGGERGEALLHKMGLVLDLLYLSGLQSVVIVQGHATASGAMLLLAADHRIGISGPAKIGLSEVRVGLPVPDVVQEMVKSRIATPYQFAVTALSELSDMEQARNIGFIDEIAESSEAALSLAARKVNELSELDPDAYRKTKAEMRSAYRAIRGGN